MEYVLLILGLVTLIIGGELLVKGAVSLALRFRISTLVVGMTIVSFGTSAPELLVSLKATLNGHPDIAVGNVVGSNIANLALVMGITAMIFPIWVDRNSIRLDWPVMMAATILTYIFMLNGWLEAYEGAIMFSCLIAYTIYLIRKSRRDGSEPEVPEDYVPVEDDFQEEPEEPRKVIRPAYVILRDTALVVLGCLGLAFGADWLVTGAIDIAHSFGVSDLVISVTVVAFGTSAPELITSIVAALRKHTDISVGNLIGSNLFNLFAIFGITSMVKPIEVNQEVLQFDMLWVLGISFLIFPLMVTGKRIARWEGALLFLVYLAYIWFLLAR